MATASEPQLNKRRLAERVGRTSSKDDTCALSLTVLEGDDRKRIVAAAVHLSGTTRTGGRLTPPPSRSDPDLDLVAAVLLLLGVGVVGRHEGLVGAHAHGDDLVGVDAARDELLDDRRRTLGGQFLVVLGLAARIRVTRDLELEDADASGLQLLLGVDERLDKVLCLLLAAGLELVAV